MNSYNQTIVTDFILRGISDDSEMQVPFFLLVLVIYLITLGGNMIIIILICLNQHLHTPMYFFVANLSIFDISCSAVTLHRVLTNFLLDDKRISFFCCMAQMYIFSGLTSNELLLLSAMSFDRYVAICNPLRYHMDMNPRVCSLLAAICWSVGIVQVLPIAVVLSISTCYKSNEINHFFCDMMPLIKLLCDISFIELFVFINAMFYATFPFLFTFAPYIPIISTILRIRFSTGRRKAFYTCSSHLTVVILLYSTLICQYLRPTSMDKEDSNKLFSLFNTAALPILNPLIYSLNNKDVKSALKKSLR
ncbi:PREDICTED: olfactory receptor 8J2-like [Nanorana parkeri]|uniref:olfactory receptor 8J2-like n=1 Tax=Nanorana parkeri TaxID=125878 RepID=UPI00085410D0|nr:PREDICTED: olfactory receptor 8J2-like [Nanorana parkeri]